MLQAVRTDRLIAVRYDVRLAGGWVRDPVMENHEYPGSGRRQRRVRLDWVGVVVPFAVRAHCQ